MKAPRSKPPPKPARYASPEERAWLDQINRQLAYDEYMQAQRERWLWERPKTRYPRPVSCALGAEGGTVLASNAPAGAGAAC